VRSFWLWLQYRQNVEPLGARRRERRGQEGRRCVILSRRLQKVGAVVRKTTRTMRCPRFASSLPLLLHQRHPRNPNRRNGEDPGRAQRRPGASSEQSSSRSSCRRLRKVHSPQTPRRSAASPASVRLYHDLSRLMDPLEHELPIINNSLVFCVSLDRKYARVVWGHGSVAECVINPVVAFF